ncbi:2'-5' RNA ligase [Dehalogenimonas sp. WBC-2]|nr:2'-5' RNA ligase [Dehalogenimonas sp. WBC-2]
MTETDLIRAFIAVELPQTVKDELGVLQKRLAAAPMGGIKWVAPEGTHLTLKFLGPVAPQRLDEVKTAMTAAVKDIGRFELGVAGLGGFPNLRRLSVVWCGLTGDLGRLRQLQQAIEEQISPLGFPSENRAFSPHLTLARLREDVAAEARQALAEKLREIKFESQYNIRVDAVSLMQSRLLPAGAVYSRVGEFPLKADG